MYPAVSSGFTLLTDSNTPAQSTDSTVFACATRTSQGELDSHNTFTILADKEQAHETFGGSGGTDVNAVVDKRMQQSMVARFVNGLHGSMDTPAQYNATISLGLPLEFTSHILEMVLTFAPMKEADAVLKARRHNKEPSFAIVNVDSKTDPCTGESKTSSARMDVGTATSSAAAHSADVSPPFEPSASRSTRSHTDKAVDVNGDEEGRRSGRGGRGGGGGGLQRLPKHTFIDNEASDGEDFESDETDGADGSDVGSDGNVLGLFNNESSDEGSNDRPSFERIAAARGDGASAARTSGENSDSIDLDGDASGPDATEDDGYTEATAGQTPNVASEDVEAGGGGILTTDGAGGAVVVGPVDDYRYRDGNEEASDGRTRLRRMSMVQFAMRMYKEKYNGKLDGADLGSRQYRLAPEHPQSERHILKERKEATRKKHVFVFIGPTRKPDEPDAFAQFVLLFFRPWRGVDGIRGLLIKSGENESGDEGGGVATHSSWEAALAAWSLADRQASDPLWYAREDGMLSHPYIDNMIGMWEGEDRAREMAAKLKAQTHAERMDLAAARGDLSDDDGYCRNESDAAYSQSLREVRYPKQDRHGRLRTVDLDTIAVQAGVDKLTETLANSKRLAGLRAVRGDRRSSRKTPKLPWTCEPTGRVDLTADLDSDEEAEAPSEAPTTASVTKGLQRDLAALVKGFRENDVDRAGRAMPAQPDSSTTAIPQGSLSALLVDLEPHLEAGRVGGVDSSRGQFVPRSELPVDVGDDCGPKADQFCGPTLIETIVRLTCNPRQAIVAFILGRAHAHEGHTKSTDIAEHFLLRGEPGTGKSRVAKVIIEWLELNASSETIAGGSFTGKAASNIGMCTLHRSVNMGVADTRRRVANGLSKRDKELAKVYGPVRTFFHDECSLTAAELYWLIATKMNVLRNIDAGQTFGNLRVVVRPFEVADIYTLSLSLYPRCHVHCTSSLHWSTPCAGCG